MSVEATQRLRGGSRGSRGSRGSHGSNPILNDEPAETKFDACAATATHFLYAQRNIISCLHHDTLAIERRFDKHEADVLLITADNVSERGCGRHIASYDAAKTVIVWDLFTGEEIARFFGYDFIRVAAWMRDGSVAFGNDFGNIIMFEPATSEHISDRTIYDPITALAPLPDCRTFAVGYQNGSILIATLQPFNVIHTLTTSRGPSPIVGLAWHGSSTKQKADMLATQTADGDLRIWSITKPPSIEQPRIIRVLGNIEPAAGPTRSWFGWSKNGRVVQHLNGETRSWDVRTKKVTWQAVPTIDDIATISNYGPTSTLFTVGRNHTVQQYDLDHDNPMIVANASHVPVNAPPTPPDTFEDQRFKKQTPNTAIPRFATPALGEASGDESGLYMASIDQISREMDDLEAERRDQLAPLSPVSSRASMSSASSYGRRKNTRSSVSSKGSGSDGTLFSVGSPPPSADQESFSGISIRSDVRGSSYEGEQGRRIVDLFPALRSRLNEVAFKAPQYPNGHLTPEVLRCEMLNVVFGWDDDIESLVRDELSHHKTGSVNSILLSRWLGDIGADAMMQMANSNTMTSSDWMLLALSCQMGGQGSQKQVGEAFVQRLLASNEVHAAVAIMLGLGDPSAAIDAYLTRKYHLEAILLTCLHFPDDWQRQSHLVRKWGESAVAQGHPQFAVRCFSCTSIGSVEPGPSTKSAEPGYDSQRQSRSRETTSPPNSPPSANVPNRITAKNPSLKLITNFGDKGVALPIQALGVTPIADTAVTPIGKDGWPTSRRDESATRTATPGGTGRRRFPSQGARSHRADSESTPVINMGKSEIEPISALRDGTEYSRKTHSRSSSRRADSLASPAYEPSTVVRQKPRSRNISTDRNHNQLEISTTGVVENLDASSPSVASNRSRTRRSRSLQPRREESISPPLTTDGSLRSFKGRNIDRYIDSLEEANNRAQRHRSESQNRADRDQQRSRSRPRRRDTSASGTRSDVTYIKPAKRSPSSPKPMTSDDASFYMSRDSLTRDNASVQSLPIETRGSLSTTGMRAPSRSGVEPSSGYDAQPVQEVDEGYPHLRPRLDRPISDPMLEFDERGRNSARKPGSVNRSPPSPAPMEVDSAPNDPSVPEQKAHVGTRPQTHSQRTRSASRTLRRAEKEAIPMSAPGIEGGKVFTFLGLDGDDSSSLKSLSRKELAAKELEDRRLSLARRPLVPPIPQPGELSATMSPLSAAEQGELPFSTKTSRKDLGGQRSQTVDPEAMTRYGDRSSGTSTSSVPIGLPATPRAMRHPRYMGMDSQERSDIPAVPALPENISSLVADNSQTIQNGEDDLGPLLPSTVYSSKPPYPRSHSAPIDKHIPGLPARPTSRTKRESLTNKTHSRRTSTASDAQQSQRSGHANFTEEDHIIVIPETDVDHPPVLEELQHLAGPPPPPPPPMAPLGQATNGSGMINIAIYGNDAPTDIGVASSTGGSSSHQRSQTLDTSSPSKWRSVADRVRGSSRSRTKSPPAMAAPYETVLPTAAFSRTKSTPPEHDGGVIPELEHLARGASPNVYRNPKEIRANMPPSSIQPGAGGMEGGMI